MATTKTYYNPTKTTYKFQIWGNPNMAPDEYEVAPGETCEIPLGYTGNFLKRRASGLVPYEPGLEIERMPESEEPPSVLEEMSSALEAKPEPEEEEKSSLFEEIGKKKKKKN